MVQAKRRAAFLDRDGTINREVGFVTTPEQLILEPGAAQAIRRLNDAGVLAIVITNQSAIARRLIDDAMLARIHERLAATLLADAGARLDAIYICPHHPDVAPCDCRKPLPGLIERAVRDHDVDRAQSVLFGDMPRDLEAARAAGVTAVQVGAAHSLARAVADWLDGSHVD
jgi:D-glycero-D-manno-heptose 1,7-bisphosphate phosphatase